MVATPGNQMSFDPQGFITITFSESLDRDSVLRDLKVLDSDGVALEPVTLSERNTVLTIVPLSSMRLGRGGQGRARRRHGRQRERRRLCADRDQGLEPRRLARRSSPARTRAPRHLELWRARDAQDVHGTYAMQGRLGFSINEPITTSLSLSDAGPEVFSRTTAACATSKSKTGPSSPT